jgi:hypothetical protein
MTETFRLSVHVQPGAKQPGIVGWVDDVLRVRVAAPPVDGKANEAFIALLSDVLGVPKAMVTIHRGTRGRSKLVLIEGLSQQDGTALLQNT